MKRCGYMMREEGLGDVTAMHMHTQTRGTVHRIKYKVHKQYKIY